MSEFDPATFSPAVQALLEPPRLAELGPGRPNTAVRDQLQALGVEDIAGDRPLRDRQMAQACISGLWLYHDFLDDSHTLSQSLHSSEGSYWHAIMHRREPDYSNSKYWFRQTGRHPVFEQLAPAAARLAEVTDHDGSADFLATQDSWHAPAFVDLCEAAHRGGANRELCQQVQQAEWQLLFSYCYERAVG